MKTGIMERVAATVAAHGCRAETTRGRVRHLRDCRQCRRRALRVEGRPSILMGRGAEARGRWVKSALQPRIDRRAAAIIEHPRRERLPQMTAALTAAISELRARAERAKRNAERAALGAAAREVVDREANYRRAASTWAGGTHRISVEIVDETYCGYPIYAAGEAEKVWSKNGKWAGNDSFWRFQISARTPRTLWVVGGLVTIDATPTEIEGVYAASWARQGRGFSLRVDRGYIAHGYHTTTARTAAAAAKAAALRGPSGAHPAGWVTLDDAKAAGLCAVGIAAWAGRHFPGGLGWRDIKHGCAVRIEAIRELEPTAPREIGRLLARVG